MTRRARRQGRLLTDEARAVLSEVIVVAVFVGLIALARFHFN